MSKRSQAQKKARKALAEYRRAYYAKNLKALVEWSRSYDAKNREALLALRDEITPQTERDAPHV